MTTRVTLRGRFLFVFAAFVAADAGLVLAACSTSSPDEPGGADATTETSTTRPDAAKDAPPVITTEAGKDGGVNCVHVTGKCDIVLQDCPAQQECVVNNSGTTECRPVQVSQQLGIGRGCCPSPTSNPCLPGLSCIGNACVDGGTPSARCSPACCEGDDQKCGKSDPEGISGACDLKLVGGGSTELHNVCTYRPRCKPFKEEPCKTGETCLVEDKVGTASCVTLFGATGKTNRQPCVASNDCEDGLQCFIESDAGTGGTCRTICLFPGATHPFDAGVEDGGPGKGGCPGTEKCTIAFSNRPSWYALCALPDGG